MMSDSVRDAVVHPEEEGRAPEEDPLRRLGFVGLGALGAALTKRLLNAGQRVYGYDTNGAARGRLADEGGIPANSLREMSTRCSIVFLCLPTPQVVLEVGTQLAQGWSSAPPRVCVDLSSSGAAISQALATIMSDHGVDFIDCPVTGGVRAAIRGQLTMVTAGNVDVLARIAPVLRLMGSNIVRVGDQAGQAQVVKVANNMLSATALLGTAEALAVTSKAGVDPDTAVAVFNNGSGKNSATERKFPNNILTRTFDSNFRLQLMVKDLGLFAEEARRMGLTTPLSESTRGLWDRAGEVLAPESDHTSIVTLTEESAGVCFRRSDLKDPK